MTDASTSTRTPWEREAGNTLAALDQCRLALRHAARSAGERRIARRLRRLARRKRASYANLRRAASDDVARNVTAPIPVRRKAAGDIDTPIGAMASALRSNRRLRAAATRAMSANPPARTRDHLKRVRAAAGSDAAALRACLNQLVVQPTTASPIDATQLVLGSGPGEPIGDAAGVRR